VGFLRTRFDVGLRLMRLYDGPGARFGDRSKGHLLVVPTKRGNSNSI
jgi:hypothetical protein